MFWLVLNVQNPNHTKTEHEKVWLSALYCIWNYFQTRIYIGPLDDDVIGTDLQQQFIQFGAIRGVSRFTVSKIYRGQYSRCSKNWMSEIRILEHPVFRQKSLDCFIYVISNNCYIKRFRLVVSVRNPDLFRVSKNQTSPVFGHLLNYQI